MKSKRTIRIAGIMLAAAIGVAACSGGDDDSATTVAVTSLSTEVPAVETSPPTSASIPPSTTVPDVPRIPLTGEPVASEDDIPQRPGLIVKVPMDKVAMPHVGLNSADIVFDTIINDNFTRLLSVFHSQSPGDVGPIRSGRLQDVNIMAAFHRPLYAWSGGNAGVNGVMAKAEEDGLIVDLRHGSHGDLYYRSDRAKGPHNLFSNTDELWLTVPGVELGDVPTATTVPDDDDEGNDDDEEAATTTVQTTVPSDSLPDGSVSDGSVPDGSGLDAPTFEVPTPIFPYVIEGEETIEGDPAEEIDVTLASFDSHWEYDPETERYFKWTNGSEHQTDDGQVWADNVVVMMMDYGVSPIDGDNPLMQSLGSNPVYVFSKGTVRSGVWLRFEPEEGWGLFDNVEDLNRIPLSPGRTWVEMPRNEQGNITYVSNDEEVTPSTVAPSTAATTDPSASTTEP